MLHSTDVHPQAVIAIDSVNNRVILEMKNRNGIEHTEYYKLRSQSFVGVIDALLKVIPGSPWRRRNPIGSWTSQDDGPSIEVGVYPGPGPFTRVRTGVLVAHWLARERFGGVRVAQIPLKAFEKPLLPAWKKFTIQKEPKVVYGKEPHITIKPTN